MLQEILEKFPDEEFLKADGFDNAIIGVDLYSMRLVYSVSKCVNVLMNDMSEDEAIEYLLKYKDLEGAFDRTNGEKEYLSKKYQ